MMRKIRKGKRREGRIKRKDKEEENKVGGLKAKRKRKLFLLQRKSESLGLGSYVSMKG